MEGNLGSPIGGELSEIFDFGLRGFSPLQRALSVTAYAVPPLPKGEASSPHQSKFT